MKAWKMVVKLNMTGVDMTSFNSNSLQIISCKPTALATECTVNSNFYSLGAHKVYMTIILPPH